MKKGLGVIFGLIFLVLTAGSFYWLWNIANSTPAPAQGISSSTTSIEVESVKKQAMDILSSLAAKSDIPISENAEKMGKTNPFAE